MNVNRFRQWVILPYPWDLRRRCILVWDYQGAERSEPRTGTVTNNADDVVRWFAERHMLKRNDGTLRRVIYRDSEGNWDELVHDGERFLTFKPCETPDHPEPPG